MTIKFNWGMKIVLLYCGFVALISTLVYKSVHQHLDLVSTNYYDAEVAYQKVLNANKNQMALSTPITVVKDNENVKIVFPQELTRKGISGTVHFYCPSNEKWDKAISIVPGEDQMTIARNTLHKTTYTVKMEVTADKEQYYQENELKLYQ